MQLRKSSDDIRNAKGTGKKNLMEVTMNSPSTDTFRRSSITATTRTTTTPMSANRPDSAIKKVARISTTPRKEY
jgi:ribosomal protein S12